MPRRNEHKQPQRRVLLVTGLAALTTEQMLLEHFSNYAQIAAVQISRDHRSKEPRGLGYITLEVPHQAAHVLGAEHRILQRVVQVHVTSKKCQRRVLHSQKMSARVYVYGLPCLTDSEDLKNTFEAFGKVSLAKVAIDPQTFALQSFGCVDFKTPEMAQKALAAAVFVRGTRTEVTSVKRSGFGPITVKTRPNPALKDNRQPTDHLSSEESELFSNSDLMSENTDEADSLSLISHNFIEEEVSNYQCLGLNPLVNLIIGTAPLVQAYYYGWFDIELVKPLCKAPGIKQELQKIRILQPDKYEKEIESLEHIHVPHWCKKTLRVPHILTDQLNQDVSNYAIRLQKPPEFLKRSSVQASYISRKKLLRRFLKRERRFLASQSTYSDEKVDAPSEAKQSEVRIGKPSL